MKEARPVTRDDQKSGKRFLWVVAAAATAITVVGYRQATKPADALLEPPSTWDFSYERAPSTPLIAGFGGFVVKMGETVHLRSARIVTIPPEIRIIKIWAYNSREGGGVLLASDRKTFFEETPAVTQYPVDQVSLDSRSDEDWQIVVEYTSDKPGRHKARGLRVDYASGGRDGYRIYPFTIGIEVVPHDKACCLE